MDRSHVAPFTDVLAPTLTQRMESVTGGLQDQFAALLSTKDFEMALYRLKYADADGAPSVKIQICEMLNQCGIRDVRPDESPEYYERIVRKSDIPAPSQLSQLLYERFFSELKKAPFPSPEEYIARIVARETDSAWKSDSLRLQILKKFLRDADGLKAAGFKSLCVKRYVREKTGKAPASDDALLASLDDGIFRRLNEDIDRLKEKEKEQKSNVTPEEYERARQARKQKNNGRGTYALLRIADDLASGRFGNANVVREEIYLFSIAYNLNYCNPAAGDVERPEYDLEKNMFRDYYTNNLMRYIGGGHAYLKTGGEEADPRGYGINWKNYMEVIFLYYSRRIDLSAREKLEGVYRTAYELHRAYLAAEKGKPRPAGEQPEDTGKTLRLAGGVRRRLSAEDDYAAFCAYILENYDCSVPPDTSNVFGMEPNPATAVKIFRELCEEAAVYHIFDEDYPLRGIVFFEEDMDPESIRRLAAAKDPEALPDRDRFNILLYEANRQLSRLPDLNRAEGKGSVSRTDFLIVFYQLYIAMNEDDDSWQSLRDVYEDFTTEANKWLSDALLQPMDGRGLLDFILIYSAYCIINEGKFEG